MEKDQEDFGLVLEKYEGNIMFIINNSNDDKQATEIGYSRSLTKKDTIKKAQNSAVPLTKLRDGSSPMIST